MRKDEHISWRDSSDQVDGEPGSGTPIEEHLDVVSRGAEVDGRTSAVEDLQGLVVARAFDVLGEEELGRRGADGQWDEWIHPKDHRERIGDGDAHHCPPGYRYGDLREDR